MLEEVELLVESRERCREGARRWAEQRLLVTVGGPVGGLCDPRTTARRASRSPQSPRRGTRRRITFHGVAPRVGARSPRGRWRATNGLRGGARRSTRERPDDRREADDDDHGAQHRGGRRSVLAGIRSSSCFVPRGVPRRFGRTRPQPTALGAQGRLLGAACVPRRRVVRVLGLPARRRTGDSVPAAVTRRYELRPLHVDPGAQGSRSRLLASPAAAGPRLPPAVRRPPRPRSRARLCRPRREGRRRRSQRPHQVFDPGLEIGRPAEDCLPHVLVDVRPTPSPSASPLSV